MYIRGLTRVLWPTCVSKDLTSRRLSSYLFDKKDIHTPKKKKKKSRIGEPIFTMVKNVLIFFHCTVTKFRISMRIQIKIRPTSCSRRVPYLSRRNSFYSFFFSFLFFSYNLEQATLISFTSNDFLVKEMFQILQDSKHERFFSSTIYQMYIPRNSILKHAWNHVPKLIRKALQTWKREDEMYPKLRHLGNNWIRFQDSVPDDLKTADLNREWKNPGKTWYVYTSFPRFDTLIREIKRDEWRPGRAVK